MRPSSSLLPLALVLSPLLTVTGHAQRTTKPAPSETPAPREDRPALAMTSAIACLSIDSRGNIEPLDEVALTSEEKLLLFYRPLNFQVDHEGTTYHMHLVQDGRIRLRGKKRVLQEKPAMIDEDWKGSEPPGSPFMRSLVALKSLPPGDYEFEIILHDRLAPGEPIARQTVPFTVVPPGPRSRNEKGEAKPTPNRPAVP